MSTDLESSDELQGLLLLMSDSDMTAAAQQLMQLSDEDNNSCCSSSSDGNNNKMKKIKGKMTKSEGCFRQSQCEITCGTFEEIFGKEEISRPTKKRKYRFIESIYKETKSVKVSYGNNLWS
ncbi:Cellulose synthase 6 [Hibiscus syriacus]|uniref:Cellulose synthase 6 n=1 Tax=Hibiscus syriacus TaxID=106335 RepID=A0A6A2WRI9_HIBSY|nr:Cellulose synthase 6 [Hibiscus syriacus]